MSVDRRRRLVRLFLAVVVGACGVNQGRGEVPRDQQTEIADTALSKKYELTLRNSRGEALEYFVREPRNAKRSLPAVFILAGIETGRESLDLIDDRDDLLLLSMNYPGGHDLRLSGFNLLTAPFALRRIAFDALEGGILALDYLSRRPDVDQDRIILLGVSFGSPIIISLSARDSRADAVVVIYGGGDLGQLARHNMRDKPWWVPGWAVPPVVRLFLGDFEPLDQIEKVAPRYLLMVSSRQDEMIPSASALSLFERAKNPKKLIWYDTGHMDLFDRNLIRRLTRDIVAELRQNGYVH
jgi:hypothetical protein